MAESGGRSLAGIAGSNPARGNECLSVVSIVCFRVEVSASGRSLAQRSSTECMSLSVISCNSKLCTHSRTGLTNNNLKHKLLGP